MSTSRPNRLARIAFWPVYFFIEKVRFARSLLLLVLLIPDGYVAYMLVRQTTDSVEFSAKESDGVQYITPARALLATVQRLRVVGQPGLDDPALAGEVPALVQRADAQLAELAAADARLGARLRTSDKLGEVTAAWSALKANTPAEADKRDQAFAALTALIATDLIGDKAGNGSNLILDPDLDSYWMMDAFVLKLPALGEGVANIGNAGNAALGDGKLTLQERLEISGSVTQLMGTANDLIASDLKFALEDNEKWNEGREGNRRLRPQLEAKFNATADALRAYGRQIQEGLLLPETPTLAKSALAAQSAALIDQVHGLQRAVGPELDLLCLERADRFRHTRFIGILVFLGAALLISYVFNGFTSSVRSAQARLEDENRRLQGDILSLLEVVSRAADGDLTARAKVGEGSLGNIADAFNQMMESWQSLVGAITTQLDRTTQAVDELGRAAGTMTQGASRQAEEVAAATGAVQRMSEGIGRVSGNASEAAVAAKRTLESAQEGSRSVQDVVQGMESLRSLVQAGAKKIKTLGDRSLEITSIIGTIAKISEQTNMLALNAAIEAARAGDQGRGFSVVADEVRKLAERTALATQEIEKLVKAIQAETAESVGAIERQTQVVEEEGGRVATAGSALARIQGVSDASSNLVTDIARISGHQVSDARSAVDTMQRINAIARDTERHAQSSLQIANGLGELAEGLRRNVGRFKVR